VKGARAYRLPWDTAIALGCGSAADFVKSPTAAIRLHCGWSTIAEQQRSKTRVSAPPTHKDVSACSQPSLRRTHHAGREVRYAHPMRSCLCPPSAPCVRHQCRDQGCRKSPSDSSSAAACTGSSTSRCGFATRFPFLLRSEFRRAGFAVPEGEPRADIFSASSTVRQPTARSLRLVRHSTLGQQKNALDLNLSRPHMPPRLKSRSDCCYCQRRLDRVTQHADGAFATCSTLISAQKASRRSRTTMRSPGPPIVRHAAERDQNGGRARILAAPSSMQLFRGNSAAVHPCRDDRTPPFCQHDVRADRKPARSSDNRHALAAGPGQFMARAFGIAAEPSREPCERPRFGAASGLGQSDQLQRQARVVEPPSAQAYRRSC